MLQTTFGDDGSKNIQQPSRHDQSGRKKENKNLRLGDVVLIVDENSARGDWPLGRVIELCPNKHGLLRSVKVKTKGGCFHKPINKLCPIVSLCKMF